MVNSRDSLDLAPFTSPAAGPVEWLISDAPVGYEEALAAMEVRAAAIARGEASELVWLLEHPPLYTAGTSTGGTTPATPFPMFETGRGGQVTYHGPGQRVVYLMLDLKLFDDLSRRIADNMPSGFQTLQGDLQRNLRVGLEAALGRLNLVTREEFEIQQAVLLRTREKLRSLEDRLAALEAAAGQ